METEAWNKSLEKDIDEILGNTVVRESDADLNIIAAPSYVDKLRENNREDDLCAFLCVSGVIIGGIVGTFWGDQFKYRGDFLQGVGISIVRLASIALFAGIGAYTGSGFGYLASKGITGLDYATRGIFRRWRDK